MAGNHPSAIQPSSENQIPEKGRKKRLKKNRDYENRTAEDVKIFVRGMQRNMLGEIFRNQPRHQEANDRSHKICNDIINIRSPESKQLGDFNHSGCGQSHAGDAFEASKLIP